MIYFLSDTHFYHFNILKLNPEVRKLGYELEILENLESIVKEGDTVYHLGDFTWQLQDELGVLERWKRLPGRKVLVMGNHDHRFGREALGEFFDEIHEFSLILEVGGLRLLLSHYPVLDLRTQRFPERQEKVKELFLKENCDLLIHGHVHHNGGGPTCGCSLKGVPCVNVNVEFWEFSPVNLEDIIVSLQHLIKVKS